MRAVNLLPPETRAARGVRKGFALVVGGVGLTLVVAVAIGGGFVLGRSHASSAQQELDAARAQLAAVLASHAHDRQGTPIVATPAVVSQIATWKTAVDTALSTRVPYDLILAQIGRLVPARVTISTLSVGGTTSSSAAAAGSGGEIALEGSAFNHDDVAQLLARLALIPQVTGATLTSSVKDAKTGFVTFTISAELKGASTGFTTTTTTASGSGT